MGRLTKSGVVSQKDINELMELSNENQFGQNDAYYKLKYYEDLEEQGRLIELPCKVGDEFWVIAYKSNVITKVKCSGYSIQEDIPNRIKQSYIWIDSIENPKDYWKLSFEEFQNQCFKTKKGAEQALAEMKKGQI